MSVMDLESIEAQLRQIRRLLEKNRSGVAVLAVSTGQAAKKLGVDVQRVQELTRMGVVVTVVVGDASMVPLAEIDRLRGSALLRRAPVGARDPNAKRGSRSKPSRRMRGAMSETISRRRR